MCAIRRRLTGEVAGVELGEGGVDVVEVEQNARRESVVGVDFDDGQQLDAERLGTLFAARSVVRVRARRSPRVAMTNDSVFSTPTSTTARKFAIWASRPRWMPPLTTRRRSSLQLSSATISAIASQSRAAKYALKRTYIRLAAFSSRRAGGCSSSKRGERSVDI